MRKLSAKEQAEFDKLSELEQELYEPARMSLNDLLKEVYADDISGLVYSKNPSLASIPKTK